jgi:hypothetical protein
MIIDSVGRVDQNPYSLQEMCTALFIPVSVMPSRWFCLLGYNPGFLFNTPFRGCVPAGVRADHVSSVLCGVLRSPEISSGGDFKNKWEYLHRLSRKHEICALDLREP